MRDASTGSGPHSTVRVCRLLGGEATGRDPTDRGKLGAKRHIVVDRQGLPLAVTIAGSNLHDSQMVEETVDAPPPLRLPDQCRARPRKRPKQLHADKGDDEPRWRRVLRSCGISPRIARRGVESSERLGR